VFPNKKEKQGETTFFSSLMEKGEGKKFHYKEGRGSTSVTFGGLQKTLCGPARMQIGEPAIDSFWATRGEKKKKGENPSYTLHNLEKQQHLIRRKREKKGERFLLFLQGGGKRGENSSPNHKKGRLGFACRRLKSLYSPSCPT